MTLVGGNITRSPGPLVVDVTVAGAVKPRKVLTRGGGRPGDRLFVTGSIGAAAAGLDWLRTHGQSGPVDPAFAECVARHRRPQPRARLGALLGRTRAASACMDLSDGLADAVRQIAEASGTGATIEAARLPIHPAAVEWFSARGGDPYNQLSGGTNAAFAVPKRSRGRIHLVERQGRGVPLTHIGQLTDTAGLDVACAVSATARRLRPFQTLPMVSSRIRRWFEQLLHTHDTPPDGGRLCAGRLPGVLAHAGCPDPRSALAFLFGLNRVAVVLGVYSNLPWLVPAYTVATSAGPPAGRRGPTASARGGHARCRRRPGRSASSGCAANVCALCRRTAGLRSARSCSPRSRIGFRWS